MSTKTTDRENAAAMGRLESLTEKMGRGLNHDFCPSLNRYVYWLKKPFGWMICGVLISGLAGLLISSQAFAIMWSLVAFLVVGVAWPWLSLKGVECVLKFDQARSSEGKATVATLELTNRWPIPVFGLMVAGEFLQEIIEDDDRVVIVFSGYPRGLPQSSVGSLSRYDAACSRWISRFCKTAFRLGFIIARKMSKLTVRRSYGPVEQNFKVFLMFREHSSTSTD